MVVALIPQINAALYASTANSIVILDEFGNGTSEKSGLSLLAAVLNNFVERGVHCPHVFVATHMFQVMNMLSQSSIIEEQVGCMSRPNLRSISLQRSLKSHTYYVPVRVCVFIYFIIYADI